MAKKKVEEKEVKTKKKVNGAKLLDDMPGEEKYQGVSPINRFNILFADLQFIFTIFTLVCFIWYLVNDKVWDILQFVLAITLFIIGYNSKNIYDKPKKAYVYYICGGIILVLEILSLVLGVI